MSGRQAEANREALDYVRRTLGPGDPARGDGFSGAAQAPEGQAVLARIMTERTDKSAASDDTTQGERPHRAQGVRRRWLVAAAAVVALGGVTAVADAMGVLPSGVVDGLTRIEGGDMGGVDLDRARMLVEAPMPDGRRTMQVWQAPNESGGTCTYTRYVAADGTEEGGGTDCSNGAHAEPLDRLPLWTGGGTTDMDGYETTYGHAAKPAVAVRITWADGARQTVRLNADGSFLTFARRRPAVERQYRTIDALDRRGKVVVSDPHA
ncbi:hypothetical protein [Streptomyces aureoverticillatus]|uniref:hypothetical protein n=1 Tax=Streptomyces aureoverticillatus TaxID=66871 RepID=UPI0013DC0B06|nr:hypothetical protein [Streptomyces aureoverticillatus]QIB47340.1 hypothetical protein G3H79_33940 [Streptomyces aureoverticillatus]